MCDKDALEPVARWWSLPVRPRGGRKITCIDGPAYRIEASGLRAEVIVREMAKHGLSSNKLQQWLEVLHRCENNSTPRRIRMSRRLEIESMKQVGDDPRPSKRDLSGFYSTGLFNGEGCCYSMKARDHRYPAIIVTMCDQDALESAAGWWGVNVKQRHGRAKVCKDGPAYMIRASGLSAKEIVNRMMKYGLSARKIEQWHKVLSRGEGDSRTRAVVAQPAPSSG